MVLDFSSGCQAVTVCDDEGLDFAKLFRYQYRIGEKDTPLPGFQVVKHGKWTVQAGPDLSVVPLADKTGRAIGHLMGIAICHDGRELAEVLCSEWDATQPDAVEAFEDHLTRAIGRYVVVADLTDGTLLYQDCSGMLGAVHCKETGVVASSLHLCLDRPAEKSPVFWDVQTDKPIGHVGAHFTEDAGVERLNPNFRFDLDTGPGARFWPRESDNFELSDAEYLDTLDAIIHGVRNFTDRLTRTHPVSLSMSGGYDSRAIYASSDQETRARYAQIFTHINTQINWIDAVIAERVCGLDRIGIEFYSAATRSRLRDEDTRTSAARGFQVASGTDQPAPRAILHGTYSGVLEDAIVLRGQHIPILKGLFLNRMHWTSYTNDFLVARAVRLLGQAESPEETQTHLSEAAHRLVESFPDNARPKIADLLFVEMVNGPDLARLFVGHSRAFYMSPYGSREMIRLLACFETGERRSMQPFYHMLFRADPRICNVPFAGEVRDVERSETEEAHHKRLFAFRNLRRSYQDKTGDSAPRMTGGPFTFFKN